MHMYCIQIHPLMHETVPVMVAVNWVKERLEMGEWERVTSCLSGRRASPQVLSSSVTTACQGRSWG